MSFVVEDPKEKEFFDAVYEAIEGDYLDWLKQLIHPPKGAFISDMIGVTPLHLACQMGRLAIARYLIECGADIHAREKAFGYTPLHFASMEDRWDTAELLLSRGADPNVKSESGWTPLHTAALHVNFRLVKVLFRYGADPYIEDEHGQTPLNIAEQSENETFFDFFKKGIIARKDPNREERFDGYMERVG